MEHVAIMKKSWGLTEKILTGQKKIESRWYKAKVAPWDRIKTGDAVYFKDSGEPVTIKATVENVIQFEGLNPTRVKEILAKYGDLDGIDKKDIPSYFELFKNKNFCMLIFLKNPKEIEPFQIDKKGYGMMSAWMCVEDIGRVKI